MLSLQVSQCCDAEEVYEVCFTVENQPGDDRRTMSTTVQMRIRAIDDLDALASSAQLLGETLKQHCRGVTFSEDKPDTAFAQTVITELLTKIEQGMEKENHHEN